MPSMTYSRSYSLRSIFIFCIFSISFILHVNAEGLLPSRGRHRLEALQAVRQHYRRQFANDTTTTTTTSDSTTTTTTDSFASTPSTDASTGSFETNNFNTTLSSTITQTATGVLGPAVFFGDITNDDGGTKRS